MIRDQFILDLQHELIIDNFAGGGGASCGIELALGRHVDIAINHDPEAVAMHSINHPQTQHHCESVWDIDPLKVTEGRPVGLAWFSPDCKHFSKAKGGKPRDKRVRGLAWVAVRWAALVRPRVIILENVEEFQTWGPLLADGTPCPVRRGNTFRDFVRQLQEKGYAVEWRELRACDFGAPTTRKRLFLVARCDGQPIAWPAPTHGAPASASVRARELKPWRTAAECIDWTLTCPSIFDRVRPLAEATMRRIARGMQRHVIEAARPFVAETPTGLVSPTLVQTGYGEREGQAPRVPGLHKPLGTIVAGGVKHALVTAFLAKHFGGNYTGAGVPLTDPMHTITTQDHHALVCAFLTKYYGEGGYGSEHRRPDSHHPHRRPLRTRNSRAAAIPHRRHRHAHARAARALPCSRLPGVVSDCPADQRQDPAQARTGTHVRQQRKSAVGIRLGAIESPRSDGIQRPRVANGSEQHDLFLEEETA